MLQDKKLELSAFREFVQRSTCCSRVVMHFDYPRHCSILCESTNGELKFDDLLNWYSEAVIVLIEWSIRHRQFIPLKDLLYTGSSHIEVCINSKSKEKNAVCKFNFDTLQSRNAPKAPILDYK